MTQQSSFPWEFTRRQLLWQAGCGFFGTAIAALLNEDGFFARHAAAGLPSDRADNPAGPLAQHFPATAKACIFLYMNGGPSHMDTFDPKPELAARDGQKQSFNAPEAKSQNASGGTLKGSPFSFSRHGESGLEISELFPALATQADELCVLRAMMADSSAHASACLQMNTGFVRPGFPSLGSWSIYGLGSENQELPGFVVLQLGSGKPAGGFQNWSAGFMPAAFQGTTFSASGEPVPNLQSAAGVAMAEQRRRLDLLNIFNAQHLRRTPANDELAARIASYELAYRMQAAAPEAVDLSREPRAVQELYGLHHKDTENFGRGCLMARRLVERGVRFVQLFHGDWDSHSKNDSIHRANARQTDLPIAGLLQDLKLRGLLDSTLVIWGGEFGRTPTGRGPAGEVGRDHHALGFSMWMAGGGIRKGMTYGATDDLGFHGVEGKMHVHDLHATILYLMGVDHKRLTYLHNGREYRLTDVHGRVIRDILA
jgi:hypothetical protein